MLCADCALQNLRECHLPGDPVDFCISWDHILVVISVLYNEKFLDRRKSSVL